MAEELPEEVVEEAEERTPVHDHDHVSAVDGSLVEHLRSAHGLDTSDDFSASTQMGLHDRLHHEKAAADE